MNISVIASEAPNGYFLPGDINEFYWGLVAFTVVFGLLFWKVGPLVKEMINKAQAAAINEATSADQAVAEAAATEAALVAELGDPNTASQQLIANAHDSAAQLRVEQNAKTQDLVNTTWQRAQSEVASMKAQLSSDLSGEVSASALRAAEAVVAGNLDHATQIQLIDDYILKVGASS